tara:strand:- start:7354 stop:8025 length:672 start_codon:yes stop_codon:yes gene_type:complete
MYKVYHKFWSRDEIDDLYRYFDRATMEWYKSHSVNATVDEAKINTGNYEERHRIAGAKILQPKNIPDHFKNKLIKAFKEDFSEIGNEWHFDEAWSVQRYKGDEGGKFEWHMDVLEHFNYNSDKTPEQLFIANTRPARKLSISVALNDKSDYNDGNFTIDAGDGNKTPVDLNKGDMCVFTSETFHSVEPVTGEGTRYALIIWVVDGEEFIEWQKHYVDNTEIGQ